MAYGKVPTVQTKEVIQRRRLGVSQRRIASGTGLSRMTSGRRIATAEELGLPADRPEPDETQLARLATLSLSGWR